VADHGTDFAGGATEEGRPESLIDHLAGNDLNRETIASSQLFDSQTGVLNHQSFHEALSARLASRAADRGVALIWIDLVGLRREFSLRGWKGAETLARRMAGTLRSVLDADALLGRTGDSSFIVAMEADKLDKAGRLRIQAVVDALTPSRQNGSETRLEVAAGVAFFPFDTDSVEDLVRFAILAADRATYVKSRNVIAFHSRMNSQIVRNHLLEVEMGKGLDQSQFRMFYQPKVNLKTGQVQGAEALIRWNHPELGTVTPSEFIPVAERSDLMHSIFEFNLRAALEDVRRWRDLGFSLPIIAVNASTANVREDEFARAVRSVMEEIGIAPTQLELEITESLAFDNLDLFRARIRQLKSIGVRVSIDDFGTRYTGFDVLKKLHLDTIKIDQCFIRGVDSSHDMQALCRTIVAMGRQLKMRTIAEGIEELGELETMRQLGCEVGQGYLFSRPVGAEEFIDFLREWPERKRDLGFLDDFSLFEIDSLYAVI